MIAKPKTATEEGKKKMQNRKPAQLKEKKCPKAIFPVFLVP